MPRQPRLGHRPDRRAQQPAAVERQPGQQVEHDDHEVAPERAARAARRASCRSARAVAEPGDAGEHDRHERAGGRDEELVARAVGLALDLGDPAEQEDHDPPHRMVQQQG